MTHCGLRCCVGTQKIIKKICTLQNMKSLYQSMRIYIGNVCAKFQNIWSSHYSDKYVAVTGLKIKMDASNNALCIG